MFLNVENIPNAIESRYQMTGSKPLKMCLACSGHDVAQIEKLSTSDQNFAFVGNTTSSFQELQKLSRSLPQRYSMLRCADCKLEFASPSVAPSVEWYGKLYNIIDLYPGSRWEYEIVAAQLVPNDSVFDFGCGSGSFLASIKSKVQAVSGADFSSGAVSAAKAKGLDVYLIGSDFPACADNIKYKHIVAFHVLEHLENPGDLFVLATQLGGPNARLWVAIPSSNRASRLYGEFDAFDGPPHHLTRWNAASLERLANRLGWSMTRIQYEPISTKLKIWEVARRTSAYGSTETSPKFIRGILRRAIALSIFIIGFGKMRESTGFSMLAEFTPTRTNQVT